MANQYWLRFNASVAPYTTSGLAPTFISFAKYDGTTLAPPGITAPFASLGIYQFTYTPSFSIAFVVDGATTGLANADRYIVGVLDPLDSLAVDLLAMGGSISVLSTASSITGLGNSLSVLSLGTTLTAIGNSLSVLSLGSTLTAIGTAQTAMGSTLVAIGNTLGFDVGFGATLSALIGTATDTFGTDSVDPTTVFGKLNRLGEDAEGQAGFNKTTGAWTIKSRGGSLLATRTMANTSTTVTKS